MSFDEITLSNLMAIQRTRSYLRCAKCSEDLSSCLPSLSFHPVSTNAHMKPLVYLTCKHIVHYKCIDNPRKLYPKCPSTDIELEEEVEMDVDGLEQPDTSSKKRTNEDMNAKRFAHFEKAYQGIVRSNSTANVPRYGY
ncbi:unnamed protein product [Rhizophagus irregularis]|nr:unnamed protein product [Rhizophagus irregularis]